MLRFSVLSSGSRANATFVEAGGVRILIDCGLSAREVARRLALLGIDPSSIDCLLVTHEHSDHIRGIPAFGRRFGVPVHGNRATLAALRSCLPCASMEFEEFESGEPFVLGGVEILPFPVVHDAVEPVGFRIRAAQSVFCQVTDTGRVTPLIREALQGAQAMVVESNHDRDLLYACEYPWQVKQRISSSHGHLSNEQAAELLESVVHSELAVVVLAHLSENSNNPGCALRTVAGRLSALGASGFLSSPGAPADHYEVVPSFQLPFHLCAAGPAEPTLLAAIGGVEPLFGEAVA